MTSEVVKIGGIAGLGKRLKGAGGRSKYAKRRLRTLRVLSRTCRLINGLLGGFGEP